MGPRERRLLRRSRTQVLIELEAMLPIAEEEVREGLPVQADQVRVVPLKAFLSQDVAEEPEHVRQGRRYREAVVVISRPAEQLLESLWAKLQDRGRAPDGAATSGVEATAIDESRSLGDTSKPKNQKKRAQVRYMGMAGVSAPNDLTFGGQGGGSS